MNNKGTETGGNKKEEEDEEGGEGEEGDGEGRRKEKVMSERDRRRITALVANTRPWLDPHYGK